MVRFGDNGILRLLVEHELYIACPMMPASDFARFCTDRGIRTSVEDLERLERLGILTPVARIQRPRVRIKIQRVSEGIRELGILEDNEAWDGETTDEHAYFSFQRTDALAWLEDGRLWGPRSRPFARWSTFKTDTWDPEFTSYYSIFQIYPLHHFRQISSREFHAEWYSCEGDRAGRAFDEWVKWARELSVDPAGREGVRGEVAAELCQAISNRYYFQTQGDRRTITVSRPGDWWDWDWEEYRRTWSPRLVLDKLTLDEQSITTIHDVLKIDATHVDPLANWYDLVSFVAADKKKRLRGAALLAQTLYSMEHMTRLLLEELTGRRVPAPGESRSFTKERVYGAGVPDDELRYLEFLANEYHLNPRPRLILVVEGESEAIGLPRIVEGIFGYTFPRMGIEVMTLHGVDNFAGRKSSDRFGALEKFIDYQHHRQTIVFVVLDREGRAEQVRDRVVGKQSSFSQKRRVTADDLFRIWEASIEFDNFSNEEIAKALTAIAPDATFTVEEIIDARSKAVSGRKDPLESLYTGKATGPFSKKALLEMLITDLEKHSTGRTIAALKAERPIVAVIEKVLRLASLNHQPTSEESWQRNQESGYLGKIGT